MKLGVKIIAGFLLVVCFTFLVSGVSIYAVTQLNTSMDNLDHKDIPQLERTAQVAINGGWQVASVRGYIITGNTSYLDDFKSFNADNDKILNDLYSNAATEEGKKFVQETQALSDVYEKVVIEKVIPLKRAGKEQELYPVMQSELEPTAKSLRVKISEYMDYRIKRISGTLDRTQAVGDKSLWVMSILSVVSLFMGVGIGVFVTRLVTVPIKSTTDKLNRLAEGDYSIEVSQHSQNRKDEIGEMARAMVTVLSNTRDVIKKLSSSSEQLAASSEELTASAEQSAQASTQIAISVGSVANGTERQVGAVNASASVVEQMAAGTQQIASKANIMAEVSQKATTAAQDGGQAIQKTVDQMRHIEATVSESAQIVSKLGERSREIGQIIDTISGIAGQTNLLALNAAIEAARAGEQGRGFAVVAEEVRKLAEQSQDAAKQISTLISEIQTDTDQAVRAMDNGTHEVKLGTETVNHAGETFYQIVALVNRVSVQVQDISAAIQQMASGSQQVVSSMKDVLSVSKENAAETQTVSTATEEQSASMEEIAASSQALSKLAEDLQSVVRRFRI